MTKNSEPTLREMEVVALVCRGHSNREIGDRLIITTKTVKFHLTNIFRKFCVKSRSELMAKMFDEHVSPDEIGLFKQLF